MALRVSDAGPRGVPAEESRVGVPGSLRVLCRADRGQSRRWGGGRLEPETPALPRVLGGAGMVRVAFLYLQM